MTPVYATPPNRCPEQVAIGHNDERHRLLRYHSRMSDYNYSTFDLGREEPWFHDFGRHLGVGQVMPNPELEDLESGELRSIRRLASSGVAVIEFGSFT